MARNDKESLIRDLEVLNALHLLPDLAALTTDEAAVLLRVSSTTLDPAVVPVLGRSGAASGRALAHRWATNPRFHTGAR